MKREIFCEQCSKKLAGINPIALVTALDAAMAAQEQVVKKHGKSRAFIACDFCGEQIQFGDAVTAQSIVPIGQHYYEWESEYLY